ncbi:TetR/AcrR family transcriptional regulator C-terminal domain-containing protein [Nonomuraea sediminis]|uniref:TetR/AcrR family transcriptional regulator C-terminal domain-containing protein n=1 Tax=Nonomuraea sediminis TaxID=2835864 RepID=UPI001BDD4A4E|nr:TetR/AcrR family transcriptional regulator C-terminal domain-containing protein [Nonomuraea sediminis]
MGLEKSAIVAAALKLLAEVGLEGLTLRRLAAELDVQAPALYWHVRNKQELLDEMAAAIVRPYLDRPPLTDPARWREWLADYARGVRNMLNSYRDGARVAAGTRPSPELFAMIEGMVASLEKAGFDATDALLGVFAISNYVDGFVVEEQADRGRSDPEDSEGPDLEMMTAAYPRLMAALSRLGDPQGDRSFEEGLQLVLDGMQERLRRQGAG